MQNYIVALALSVLALSCSKGDLPADGHSGSRDSLAATYYMDVSYGNSPQQKMDVYLPEYRSSKTPTVIIIHGGGWTAGDKSDFTAYITEFQKRLPGYAFANFNYRLVTEDGNYFPTQENDIKSAIEFLKGKSKDYVISNDFIFLGISAGAHLAMLQAYKHNDIAQPKGVISYFGPVDLEQLYINSNSSIPWVLKTITGFTLEDNRQIFVESSPINYVSAQSAPTLMLHGDKDSIVPLEQAQMLHRKLDNFHVNNKLIVYKGEGHGWVDDNLNDSFNKIEEFIKGL
jgi:acetyl esterase/lipase